MTAVLTPNSQRQHRADREEARRLFDLGVLAADPVRSVKAAMDAADFNKKTHAKSTVIAFGKAACLMLETVLEACKPSVAIAVTNAENARPIAGAELFVAAHPVPDLAGAKAALRVEEALANAQGSVLALISGGGSALLPAPCIGLSLEDKQRVNTLLLQSGADITTMNLVRQHLSRLKGGGFLRAATPAKVTALILSDVIGDDPCAIASGPTAAPIGTRQEAIEALKRYEVWDKLPDHLQNFMRRDMHQLGAPRAADNRIIGSNAISVAAMQEGAPQAARIDAPLVGDVAAAAQIVLDQAAPSGTTLWGGETTVKIKGAGKGGRNQELALRVAIEAEKRGLTEFAFLSGGTDGRDGPTDAAGAIVDEGSLSRIRAAGLSPEALLAENDSYKALQAAGDLLITGGTGTNVADLQVFIRPER